jgi:hypothetical protein
VTDGPTADAPPGMTLRPGPPAWATAVVAPLVAVALVAYRAWGPGLARTADDPVSPWVLAVLTVAVGVGLSYRALTQRAVLGQDDLHCRNLLTTFTVGWDQLDRLEVVRRWGLVVIDVHVRGMRRRHRLGAATRVGGEESDVVLDVLRAHPLAGALLGDDGP